MTKTGLISFFLLLNFSLGLDLINLLYFNYLKQGPFQIYKYKRTGLCQSFPLDSLDIVMPDDSITPIDVISIKKKYAQYSTSTVIPLSESQGFYRPDQSGFYGLYTLYDDNIKSVCGEMTIFNKGTPQNWKYDNEDDIFISLDFSYGDLMFLKNIRLGLSEKDLKEKLKNYFHYKKGMTIHADIGNYSSDFLLEKDTISKIKIKYKENY